jgi:tetratricopeptide (TPR) repeat protein
LRRIQRRNEDFNITQLGAIGADLVVTSKFFDSLWDKPVAELAEVGKAYILNNAGYDLRALGRLKEAAQPMQAALEARIALKDWKNAAVQAGNLSELYLTFGDTTPALEYANQSVDLADRSGDAFQRISKRTTLADALYQAGRQSEAKSLFREAEELQKEDQPDYLFLYSLQGFRYCDLLLSQGKYQEVLSLAETALQIALNGSKNLLDIALNNLSLGRAHLLQALQEGRQDFTQAAEHLKQAVDGLRQSGNQDDVPRGLLARAELYRVQGEFEKALRDIEEAMTIAERGEMGLHQADCHLEYARLYLARGKKEDARKCLDIAKEMVDKMEYHRRDKDLKEIEGQLKYHAS